MAVKIQTIKDIRIFIRSELASVFNDREIKTVSDVIIKTATGITKLHQLYDDRHIITVIEKEKIAEFVRDLKTGKPIQYVVGETVFYDCTIKLDNSTLIPRPETEELVDLILSENKEFTGKIIDFGSGSGCIPIALAANLPFADLTGIEISDDAINIAGHNAIINNVKVKFLKSDIFNFDFSIVDTAGIIVSNPPYVRDSERAQMAKNVLDFEPTNALFVSDSDPLIYYKSILKITDKILLPGGRLYFEINEAMGKPMAQLVNSFDFSETEIVQDINGKDRILKSTKNARV